MAACEVGPELLASTDTEGAHKGCREDDTVPLYEHGPRPFQCTVYFMRMCVEDEERVMIHPAVYM